MKHNRKDIPLKSSSRNPYTRRPTPKVIPSLSVPRPELPPDSNWIRRKTSMLWYIRWITERGRHQVKYIPADSFEAEVIHSLCRDGDISIIEAYAHSAVFHLQYNLRIRHGTAS